MRKIKTKIHFNRVNMQRGDKRVWSAHTSKACNMAEEVKIIHNGEVVAKTVFNPTGKQPKAWFEAIGNVRYEGNTAIVEI